MIITRRIILKYDKDYDSNKGDDNVRPLFFTLEFIDMFYGSGSLRVEDLFGVLMRILALVPLALGLLVDLIFLPYKILYWVRFINEM